MLDSAHSLTLRAVAKGVADDSPALRTLKASGLVEEGEAPGGYRLTPAGKVALEASTPKGIDRVLNRAAGVGLILLAVGYVGGWLVHGL
jgi:hypothetical protein